MLRIFSLVVLLTLLAQSGSAQSRASYEAITVSTSAVAITAAIYNTMRSCSARVETDTVRVRLDGTAPTSSVGIPMSVGDVIEIDIYHAERARFIRSGSSDATVHVWCWF